MTSFPLHPALVHLPLGLAFILPALSMALVWALWTNRVRSRAWVLIIVLQAVLLGAGLLATNTGEREAERVEGAVPEAAVERHEELAKQFIWATAITLVLAVIVLIFRRPAAVRTLAAATVFGSLIVAGSAIRVGHAGGQLVYVHNAGAAYASANRASVSPTNPGTNTQAKYHRAGDHEGDEHGRER